MNYTIENNIDPESHKLYSGTTVNFSCKENYTLNDTETTATLCKQNGEWDVSIPHCIKSEIIVIHYRVATITLNLIFEFLTFI